MDFPSHDNLGEMNEVKIVALSDLHGQTAALPGIGSELSSADLVALSGDITDFGDAQDMAAAISAVRAYNAKLLAVAGNCDRPDCETALEQAGIALNGRATAISGYSFIGLGGSLPCPGRTPNEATDDVLAKRLESAAAQRDPSLPCILVCHQPPFETDADLARTGGHVGSRAVRAIIERIEPIVCFTGHIHEARSVSRLGRTLVVNPGPWAAGDYAIVEVERGVVSAELKCL